MRIGPFSSLAAAAFLLMGAAAPAPPASELDASRSKILVEVGKSGVLSFAAGHSHKVEAPLHGTLSVDPEHPESAVAAFEVRTSDLTVLQDGEPPQDVPKVQETMASERVLDVRRYPTVSFQSRRVQVRERHGAALDLNVTGDLALHGTIRTIVVPVRAHFEPERITARGAFAIKQTDFGIKPITVAGGAVSVKDELKIDFTIVAGSSD
jgi:polyisoprenoid-binding protein YceI